jgi:3-vinyl bacteriochlorophyllide hydratase
MNSSTATTSTHASRGVARAVVPRPLYTPEQKARRDASKWTLVQGILAPLQFFVMIGSTVLVIRSLRTGTGLGLADASVIVKTALLYTIMITGSLWEKDVFGKYLFAGPFFWEDVVSMGVIALHTAYLGAWITGIGTADTRLMLALAAYAAYSVNAIQFVHKLRLARRSSEAMEAA